jgi:GNAT superfamily N-acetyltransferase
MSLLADYFKEKDHKEIIESEKGFATYYFLDEGCYVQDIYVSPEYRNQGIAKKMLDEISEIATKKGYKSLYGSCCPSMKDSTSSLKAAFAYGFELDSSASNFIVYKKGLV